MATILKQSNKSGKTFYKVRVSGGRSRRVTRNWYPQDGWSARTIERELNKFAASLENELASGDLVTHLENLEQKKEAAIEAAKMKTVQQYADGVFMPSKEISFSENARSNYRAYLDKHILAVLGDYQMVDITPAMLTKFFVDLQRNGYTRTRKIKHKGSPDTTETRTLHYSHSTIIKCYIILFGALPIVIPVRLLCSGSIQVSVGTVPCSKLLINFSHAASVFFP